MRCKAKIGSKAERTRQYVSISNRFSTPQRAARNFFNSLLGLRIGRPGADATRALGETMRIVCTTIGSIATASIGTASIAAGAIGFGLSLSIGPEASADEGDATVPDISGYWMISFEPLPPHREPTSLEQSLIDRFAPGTVLLGDAGLPEFPPGEYGGLEILAPALEAAKTYDPDVQRRVATVCKPPGLIYSMQGPFAIEILQATELIVIKMEYYDAVRIVFMNENEHPEDWPLSNVGHSVGGWDGDTLVVDTARLMPATLFNNGLDHTEQIRLIERFRRSEDGSTLVVTQEFEDPGVFEGRAARVLPLEHGDEHVYPYDCDPSYGLAIQTRDRG
jgi:hypothetical protein